MSQFYHTFQFISFKKKDFPLYYNSKNMHIAHPEKMDEKLVCSRKQSWKHSSEGGGGIFGGTRINILPLPSNPPVYSATNASYSQSFSTKCKIIKN